MMGRNPVHPIVSFPDPVGRPIVHMHGRDPLTVLTSTGEEYCLTEERGRLCIRLRWDGRRPNDAVVLHMPQGNVVEVEPRDRVEEADDHPA